MPRTPRRPPTKIEALVIEALLALQVVGVMLMFGLPIYALLR